VNAQTDSLEVWGFIYRNSKGEITAYAGFSNPKPKYSYNNGWIKTQFANSSGILTDIGEECFVGWVHGDYDPKIKMFVIKYQYKPVGYILIRWYYKDIQRTKRVVFVKIYNGSRYTETKYDDGELVLIDFNGELKLLP